MINTRNISIRISDETEKILDELGWSLSDAASFLLARVTAADFLPDDDFVPEISDDEILRKLEEAEEDFRMGRTYTKEEVFAELEKRYGIQT